LPRFRAELISFFQISVSPQESQRNACIAGTISVRGSECVSLIFFPHFSHWRSTNIAGGSTASGFSASVEYVSRGLH
jgi:hypothetical protein